MPVFSCGRSLYIDWRMVVVVGGKCPTSCRMGGGIVRARKCPGGTCPVGICPGEHMPRASPPKFMPMTVTQAYAYRKTSNTSPQLLLEQMP